jgi:hypothetical protein
MLLSSFILMDSGTSLEVTGGQQVEEQNISTQNDCSGEPPIGENKSVRNSMRSTASGPTMIRRNADKGERCW